MSVTIKEIAEIAGVSRGTVDRVLNNRGKVNAEVEKRVNEIAKRMNYRPNRAAKALAARKKPIKLGFIVPAEGNIFFNDVITGARKQLKDLSDFGVSVVFKSTKGYDVDQQLQMIDELVAEGINGLIITPIDDPAISEKINLLSDAGIPVVTTNSDINNSKRLSYVGSDYYKGGTTAGALMRYLLNPGDEVAIITGSLKMLGHRLRVNGFEDKLSTNVGDVKVIDIKECNDDIFEAYEATKEILTDHPKTKALYIGAGGTEGVCEAVRHMGLEKQVKIICFDLTSTISVFMRDGMIDFAILQEPEYQGRKPVELLFEYLVNNVKPRKDVYYTKTEICIPENM